MKRAIEPPRYAADYQALERLFSFSEDPWRFGSDPYERKRLARTLAVCRKVPHGRIVELGCAEGHMTAALTTIADRVLALDVSPTAVKRTKRRAPKAEVMTGTLESFVLNRHFDIAVCTETLYYCRDISQALRSLCALADFVLVSYTIHERRRLDRYFAEIPALHDEMVRVVGFWRGTLQFRGSRLLLFWSGAAPWASDFANGPLQSSPAPACDGADTPSPR